MQHEYKIQDQRAAFGRERLNAWLAQSRHSDHVEQPANHTTKGHIPEQVGAAGVQPNDTT